MTSHGQGDKRDVMMQEVKWPIYARGSTLNCIVNLNNRRPIFKWFCYLNVCYSVPAHVIHANLVNLEVYLKVPVS